LFCLEQSAEFFHNSGAANIKLLPKELPPNGKR